VADNAQSTPGADRRISRKQIAVILKRFESPDEVRVLQKGRFELVHIGGMTIGRAVYESFPVQQQPPSMMEQYSN